MALMDEVLCQLSKQGSTFLHESSTNDSSQKSFHDYLKILLTPTEWISNQLLFLAETQVSKDLELLYTEQMHHFFNRKRVMKKKLQESDLFFQWFCQLSVIEISEILKPHAKISTFYRFTLEIIQEKLPGYFLEFDTLLSDLIKTDLQTYTLLSSFRTALLTVFSLFYQKNDFSQHAIQTVTETILNTINELPPTPTSFETLKKHLSTTAMILQRCFYFFDKTDDEFDIIDSESYAIKLSLFEFELMNSTMHWLSQQNPIQNEILLNKPIVSFIFNKIYLEKKEIIYTPHTSSSSFLSKTLSLSSGFFPSSLNSFFSSKEATNHHLLSSTNNTCETKLLLAKRMLDEAQTPNALLFAIQKILFITELKEYHERFVSALIFQCWQEQKVQYFLLLSQLKKNMGDIKKMHEKHNEAVTLLMLKLYHLTEESNPIKEEANKTHPVVF